MLLEVYRLKENHWLSRLNLHIVSIFVSGFFIRGLANVPQHTHIILMRRLF